MQSMCSLCTKRIRSTGAQAIPREDISHQRWRRHQDNDTAVSSNLNVNITARDLITPIDIEYKSRTRSDQGGTQVAWLPQVVQAMAADIQRTMPTITAADKLISVVLHTFYIRWRPNHGIMPGMRVNIGGGEFYYIQTVEDVKQAHKWLKMTCTEVEPLLAGSNN